MTRYIHGSEDSLDIDTHYVFEEMPSFRECQEFCKSNDDENKNIIIVKNGVIVECFKGTVDEVNNGLIMTYDLHEQCDELIVKHTLKRDILMKDIRAIRGMLSYFTRTKFRAEVKTALKSGMLERIRVLELISANIDMLNSDLSKKYSNLDIKKVFAFQLGQAIGLHDGKELYTKSEVSKSYVELKPFLYRQDSPDMKDLKKYLDCFIDILKTYIVDEEGYFVNFKSEGKKVDLKYEKYL